VRRLLGVCVAVFTALLLVPAVASAANSSAQIVNCPPASGCFSPNPIMIKVGDTVTWMNNGSITHTSTSDTGAWDTGPIASGATSSAVSFKTAGTFAYHCSIHPSMTGTVIVSAVAETPAPTSPPVSRLAQGGGGPLLPVAAGLLLAGFGLLALGNRRRHRSKRV
jgi:plastocyanin